jgi:hypothetical protein
MGLYKLTGRITRLGQCEFTNDYEIYAFVEVTTSDGRRELIRKVAVFADIAAALLDGADAEFFFDDVFVPGGRVKCQLWGIRSADRAVIDNVNMRHSMMRYNLLCGVLFTPVFGAGALRLAAGIGQLVSVLNGSTNRSRLFDGLIVDQSKPEGTLGTAFGHRRFDAGAPR